MSADQIARGLALSNWRSNLPVYFASPPAADLASVSASLRSLTADTAAAVTLTAQAYTTVLANLTHVMDVTTGASDATITLLSPVSAGVDAIQQIRKIDSGVGRVVVKYAGVVYGFLVRQGEIVALRSDGTTWRPVMLRARQGVLAQSAVAVPLTGSGSAEVVLATINLPAGLLGLNDAVVVDSLWSCTNNANVKTGRIRLGGLSGSQVGAITLTSTATGRHLGRFANRGAANSQVYFAGGSGSGTSSSALGTAAIDTTLAQDLVLTAQDAGSANAVTLESYRVELQSI